MNRHEAAWEQQPDIIGGVGQYYCTKCKLTLEVGYNQNRDAEVCSGWQWEIVDHSGKVVYSNGNKYVRKYEFDAEALEDVKKEGLLRFDSVPCRRCN
jgi:hypothetical protein